MQGAKGARSAPALPAHGRGSEERDMAHAAPRKHHDADHGGDEEGARANRARPVEDGGPVTDPIQTPFADAQGPAGKADEARCPGVDFV